MIKFTIDTKDLEKKLKRFAREKREEFVKAMETVATQIEAESVKRAPIDEGHLQNSHRHEVEDSGTKITARTYIPVNSPAADYALPMHEADYELGEASKQKQEAVGVKVGKKYMERALWEGHEEYFGTLVRLLRKTF